MSNIAKKIQQENDHLEKWQADERQWHRQQASYDILKEKAEQSVLEKDYLDKLTAYESAKEIQANNEREQYNLLYAKERESLAVYEQKKVEFERMLAEKDEAGAVEDLEKSLEQVNATIHGFFTERLESLDQNIQAIKIEQRPLIDRQETIEKEIAKQTEQKVALEQAFHEIKGDINSTNRQITEIKQQILANPSQENVYTESKQWEVDYRNLEDELNDANNFLHRKAKEKQDVMTALEETREKLQKNNLALQRETYEQERLLEAQKQ